MHRRGVVSVLAALVCACAGAAPDGAAPDGGPSRAPNAASGADAGPTGGGGLGGGASDAGTGSGAADAGAGAPWVPLDAGPVATSLCTMPGDGGPDLASAEPGLSSSCDGVLPTVAQAGGAADFDLGTMGADCRGATSDGRGAVALLLQGSANSNDQPYAEVEAADGGLEREPTAQDLAPQPAGFAVVGVHLDLQLGTPHDSFFHFSFSPDPPPLLADLDGFAIAAAPGGGALVAEATANLVSRFLSARRFDAAGRLVAAPVEIEAPADAAFATKAVAVSTQGEGLVAFTGMVPLDDGWIDGMWVHPDGSSDRAVVRLAAGRPRKLALRPLADGSIAVRADGVWVARARPSGAVEAPPAWLASHPSSELFLRASGKGYVLQAAGGVDPGTNCAPMAELRAPAGNLCAVVGTVGRPAAASLGLDGTLFGKTYGMPCDFGLCCHVRWWKGALP